jgi:hypothetical protein
MKVFTFKLIVCFAALGLISLTAFAGPPPAAPKPPQAAEQKPDFPPFDEIMKDYAEVPTAEPPFFTILHNKKTDSLRAIIPSSMIGQKFLIASSMAGGSVATGFQLDHFLAYFDRMDKNLVLMRVDPRYVEGGNEPVADVIKRSYGNDEIMRTIPILSVRGSDPVIDLDQLFKSDFSSIGGWGLGSVNPTLSKWAKYKAFPQNIELEVDLALMRGNDGGRRTLFHYSISKIPDSSSAYKPRLADPRVGYFMTVRKDWSKEAKAPTLFNRYINRWLLEKRDPTADMSAPKNPIVWYIEKTVPLKYRRWVKEGILEWNKAYAKCGFLDAIEVKQQEDYDAGTKDLDPEDVRYNFFRWIVTGRAFAMGPSRDHPLTGQIFDADIVFDDSMARAYVASYERLSGGENSWRPYEPIVDEFFKAHPEWLFHTSLEKLLPTVALQQDPDREFRENLMEHMFKRGRPICECASGMADQLQFAGIALEAKGLGRNDDDFIGQIIKEIVMHEVGHCLGLRHNFKGSTWLPMNEVEDQTATGEANVGTVMDYNPPIISARGKTQPNFVTRTIGPYDYWAIEYGYRPVGGQYKGEDEMLKKIASRSGEPGLDYGTDEDTMSFISPDPLSNRYDMGREVTEFANRQVDLMSNLLTDISDWSVKDGESYSRLRKTFLRVLGERARVCDYVARFVGGQIINRDYKGDPSARKPIQVVDAKKQHEALEFVCKRVFAEDSYNISPKLLSLLAPGRQGHWDSDDFDFQVEFNVHDVVAGNQYGCLLQLMNPFTINRIHDNQVKFEDDAEVYTLSEHLKGLTNSIWSELDDTHREGTDRKAFINSFRRNLQRNHLEMLMNLVLTDPDGTVPADANAIARNCVARLSDKIGKTLKSAKLDDTSEAHLIDVKKRIDKALEAQYSIGGMRMSDLMFFFREAAKQKDAKPVSVLPN